MNRSSDTNTHLTSHWRIPKNQPNDNEGTRKRAYSESQTGYYGNTSSQEPFLSERRSSVLPYINNIKLDLAAPSFDIPNNQSNVNDHLNFISSISELPFEQHDLTLLEEPTSDLTPPSFQTFSSPQSSPLAPHHHQYQVNQNSNYLAAPKTSVQRSRSADNNNWSQNQFQGIESLKFNHIRSGSPIHIRKDIYDPNYKIDQITLERKLESRKKLNTSGGYSSSQPPPQPSWTLPSQSNFDDQTNRLMQSSTSPIHTPPTIVQTSPIQSNSSVTTPVFTPPTSIRTPYTSPNATLPPSVATRLAPPLTVMRQQSFEEMLQDASRLPSEEEVNDEMKNFPPRFSITSLPDFVLSQPIWNNPAAAEQVLFNDDGIS